MTTALQHSVTATLHYSRTADVIVTPVDAHHDGTVPPRPYVRVNAGGLTMFIDADLVAGLCDKLTAAAAELGQFPTGSAHSVVPA